LNYQKFIFIVVCSFIFTFSSLSISAFASEEEPQPSVSAAAWIILDTKSGEVVAEHQSNEKLYPASITKIITTIIALETRKIDEIVTISKHADETIGSNLDLQEGDQIVLKDLLYGIMLHSGNDGAVAVAEHISGTEEAFAQLMTEFALEIGTKNSHFMNASGLPDPEHYTTAYDMAVITRYAMKDELFREMASAKTYAWDSKLWSDDLKEHEEADAKLFGFALDEPQVVNHNRLLYDYEGAIGVKNGFTHEARYTLVGSAIRDETELIAVILRSQNADTTYQDINELLDYGFAKQAFIQAQEQEKLVLQDPVKETSNEPAADLNSNIEKVEEVEVNEPVSYNKEGVESSLLLIPTTKKGFIIPIAIVISFITILFIVFFQISRKRKS
jgi:D-alanyl-D-alanine carboxypeptidase (penicillin-binding protein 5/6)